MTVADAMHAAGGQHGEARHGPDVGWLRTLYAECLRRAGESTCSLPDEIDRGAVRMIAEALANSDRGAWDRSSGEWRPQIEAMLVRVDGVDAEAAASRAWAVTKIAPCEAQEILDGRADRAEELRAEAERFRAAAAEAEPDAPARMPVLVRLDTVRPEAVTWLWEPYVPRGKLTLLEGDPSVGKTWLSLSLAAIASRGWPWPSADTGIPGTPSDPGAVIYLTAEDGIADTIVPRLYAAGADMSRIHCLTGGRDADSRPCDVGLADVDILDRAMREVRPCLLVVDPLQGFLGAGVDMHRANEVRPVLAGLSRLAEQHGCAVVAIRHLSKSRADRAIYRGLGSIDFTAAARSVLIAARDPDDDHRRAIIHAKSSCAPAGISIGYVIAGDRLEWTGKSDMTAASANAPEADAEDRDAVAEAKEFLFAALRGGARPTREVERDAKAAGISARTLERARRALKVRSSKAGFGGSWVMEIPEEPRRPPSPPRTEPGGVGGLRPAEGGIWGTDL